MTSHLGSTGPDERQGQSGPLVDETRPRSADPFGVDVPGVDHRRRAVDDPALGRPSAATAPVGAGPTYAPRPGAESSSTTDVAKDQAGEVASTAKDAGKQVAQTAQEQVGQVTAEAGRQARQLADQVRSEVTDQASTQQQRVAGGIRSLADELRGMANGNPQDGAATDLARQAADRMHGVAEWLQDREPGDVLNEVRSFARRRPGVYLAVALGAGVLAGRLTRGLTADAADGGTSNGGSRNGGARRPAAASTGSTYSSGASTTYPSGTPTFPATGVAPDPLAPTTAPATAVPPMPGTGTVIAGGRGDLAP